MTVPRALAPVLLRTLNACTRAARDGWLPVAALKAAAHRA